MSETARRTTGGVIALFFLMLWTATGTAMQQKPPAAPAAPQGPPQAADPWFVRTTRGSFQTLRGPDARFSMEYPSKDWLVVPSGGAAAVILAQKKGDAAVVVERAPLRQELAPEEITDLFAQLETDVVRERQPKAADFQSRVIDAPGRRLVVLQYVRPGVAGPERVRQYSIPVGKQLYRLTFAAPVGQFPSFDVVFSHMAAAFTVLPASE